MASRFQRYGVWWANTVDPISMEIDMVRHGGRWKKTNGEMAGEGLFFHFKRLQQLLWPDLAWHRWRDLQTEMFLTHTYIGEMGCAAAGKSQVASANFLADWYVWPDCTTVLVSSTDLASLDLRSWGMVKQLHRTAKQHCLWLPGHLIEGRRVIINDPKHESVEGRDFKNGICFPSGSLIDTPSGQTPIETLHVGDLVFNAAGVGRILETQTRTVRQLVRVTLSDGRFIECTGEHPILTQNGWKKAVDLEAFDMVFSSDETLQILRHSNSQQHHLLFHKLREFKTVSWLRKANREWLPRKKFLFHQVSRLHASQTMRSMREFVQGPKEKRSLEDCKVWTNGGSVLQPVVFGSVGFSAPREFTYQNSALQDVPKDDEWRSLLSELLLSELQAPPQDHELFEMRKGVPVFQRQASIESREILQSRMSSRNPGTSHSLEFVPEINNGTSSRKSIHRCGVSENKTSSGTGRQISPQCEKEGCSANHRTHGTWVVRSEVLEQGVGAGFDKSAKHYQVHNISVENHPSYSVNGVVVHNCAVPCKKGSAWVGLQAYAGIHNKRVRLLGDELALMARVFLDSTANLSKCEDFKMVGLGNPNETTNAHGVLCEPSEKLGGWEGGIDQQPGTKTWETRWPNGICVQLPGDDSPNMDVPIGDPPPFPFLMTRKQMEDDAKIWGRDDWHFSMMNSAKMPRGQGSRRVVTRQMCEKFGAVLEPFWRDSNRTKIAFLDAAYRGSGGDRCVFGELQFGLEAENDLGSEVLTGIISQKSNVPQGRQILALIDMVVIPIKGDIGAESPEDQIVKFVQDQCTARGIAAENFFYDSGMRTSLVTAFSRMGFEHAESVDCGGKPTEDIVSAEINQRCCDYYQKKITELWYSVRYIIEARQFRGLNKDVMWELCAREWKHTPGTNKIEVESKEEMKVKTGRSPDLADALAVGCFGARQRGFQIARLMPKEDRDPRKRDWRDEIREKARTLWASGQLDHAA